MAEGEEESEKIETHQLLFEVLRGVYRVARDLRLCGGSTVSCSKAVLELRTASEVMVVSHPLLLPFAGRLRQLADSVEGLQTSKPAVHGLVSFVGHRLKSHEVSRLVWEIEPEIQALMDREVLLSLREILARTRSSEKSAFLEDEDNLLEQMSALQERLSRGFDKDFQDLLLRSGIFSELEWVLRNTLLSKRVREKAAVSIRDLVLFNKDVFVGTVLVGGTVKALVSIGSCCSLLVLSSLIKAIRSPLVDELESSGCILDIVGYLSSEEPETRATALYCIMQAVYFGRKQAIESLINSGLIRRLVELLRAEQVCNTRHPFSDCVARFVLQLEAGEGLRQRERRAFKAQILSKVREACDSDSEAASIMAEVLWYSCP